MISLAPDLVLAADDAGPAATMELLAEAGVPIVVAPATETIDDVPSKIRFVGEAIGDAPAGDALAAEIAAEVAKIRAAVRNIESAPRVLFILSVRGGAPLVGGAGTSAHMMIVEAGATNVAADLDGWKQMNSEAIITAAPDVVVMTTAHSERLGGLEEVLARPDIALTPAGAAKRGVSLDAMLLLGMGPRVAIGIEALARAVHPAATLKDAGL
ncbi:MAG: ABC transporter substrate-binding protein [Pseudomonadota bacterium]